MNSSPIRKGLAVAFLVALASRPLSAAPGDAGDTIFATCSGIKGDVLFTGYKDWINVFGFGHGIVSPRDSFGQLTGRRQHQPLRLFKTFDRATPSLYLALVRNDRLASCEIESK